MRYITVAKSFSCSLSGAYIVEFGWMSIMVSRESFFFLWLQNNFSSTNFRINYLSSFSDEVPMFDFLQSHSNFCFIQFHGMFIEML